ncbi:hypothetical protein B0H14DRAFT_3438778 [Mycena olivaceomarginata]|nr:hypothetical protein B0H14DRAFT_3438778 [Mycena olivaceomarginata]
MQDIDADAIFERGNIGLAITKRGSWIWGQIVTACRASFALHYKFNRTSTSTATIKTNRDLSEKLAQGKTYHYKDIDAGTGYGENGILSHIRKAVVFKDKKKSLLHLFGLAWRALSSFSKAPGRSN